MTATTEILHRVIPFIFETRLHASSENDGFLLTIFQYVDYGEIWLTRKKTATMKFRKPETERTCHLRQTEPSLHSFQHTDYHIAHRFQHLQHLQQIIT